MKNALFYLLILVSVLTQAQELKGDWHGNLNIKGQTLALVFHLDYTGDAYKATMDSPKQMAYGIEVSQIQFNDPELELSIAAAGIQFSGRKTHADTIKGNFQQGGMQLPLTLIRSSEKLSSAPKRPQTPQPPFPYQVEEVRFKNQKDTVTLAGTLSLPQSDKPVPAVVLVSGSGPQDRNEELFNHKPFWVIADYLTRNGIAVLRYDDRGTAESTGDFSSGTTHDFAEDAKAALMFLRSRKEISKHQIGVIGHSEGGIIAPMLAAENEVNFIVLMAGTGLRGDKLLHLQRKAIAEQQGIPASVTEAENQVFEQINKLLLDTTLTDELRSKRITQIVNENWKNQYASGQREAIVAQLNSPWMLSFTRLDPTDYLQQVTCPVLVLNGEKDIQVPAKENTTAIKKALAKAGNSEVRLNIYPTLNHLFQEAETGAVHEYAQIEQTISPKVLADITQWILKQTSN